MLWKFFFTKSFRTGICMLTQYRKGRSNRRVACSKNINHMEVTDITMGVVGDGIERWIKKANTVC